MKTLKNQNGFTLVEILVVIAIIAILFVTLLPQIDRATDRARHSGVKSDFRAFQMASETYLRLTGGKNFSIDGYNGHLDDSLQMIPDKNISDISNPGMDSKKKDPWGITYDIGIYPENKMIIIRSFGPNETFEFSNVKNDNLYLATYYINGVVTSCTKGFKPNDIVSDILLKSEKNNASWECGRPLRNELFGTALH